VDLTDRMIEHDLWLTRQLLDAAATLPEEQLDERFDVAPGVPYDFDRERPSVRDMLERLIVSKEVWTAAIAGREAPTDAGRSVQDLRDRFERRRRNSRLPSMASGSAEHGTPPSSMPCANRRRRSRSAGWSRTC
jgi:AraC family transcriptional regulator